MFCSDSTPPPFQSVYFHQKFTLYLVLIPRTLRNHTKNYITMNRFGFIYLGWVAPEFRNELINFNLPAHAHVVTQI